MRLSKYLYLEVFFLGSLKKLSAAFLGEKYKWTPRQKIDNIYPLPRLTLKFKKGLRYEVKSANKLFFFHNFNNFNDVGLFRAHGCLW